MSKKNNKSIKARAHAHDLQREKLERERLAKMADKNERKSQRRVERVAAAGGVAKKHKKKTFRIRKGVQIKGIKVVDSDSKRKVLKLLKAEQAAKMMDADGPGAAAASSTKERKKKKSKVKVTTVKSKSKAAAAAAAPAAMET